jgi:hypothetical protein
MDSGVQYLASVHSYHASRLKQKIKGSRIRMMAGRTHQCATRRRVVPRSHHPSISWVVASSAKREEH